MNEIPSPGYYRLFQKVALAIGKWLPWFELKENAAASDASGWAIDDEVARWKPFMATVQEISP